MPDEKALVVCRKVADLILGGEIAGSQRGHYCRDCEAELTIAPAGQGVLARDPTAETICLECDAKLAAAGEVGEVELAPGAAKELITHLFNWGHRN
jgi:hypothetical protein